MADAWRRSVDRGLYRPARGGTRQARTARPVAARLGVIALRSLARLPYPAVYRLAGALGRVFARLPAKPVRFTDVTLRICFPDMQPQERQRLARRSLMEAARAALEVGVFWTWPRDRVLGLVRGVSGEEVLQAARSEGKGVLVVAPHIGAWELNVLYCSSRFPVTTLYTHPTDACIDTFFTAGRSRFGARLVPSTPGGIRSVVRALAEGHLVGILPDQDPRRGAGVFVPFFGVPANTSTLVSRLAQRTGAPVVLLFAERLAKGAGFHIHFRPASGAVRDADAVRATAALNLDIERLVRECPEQYLWSYKRFRVRPRGEPNPYRAASHADTGVR